MCIEAGFFQYSHELWTYLFETIPFPGELQALGINIKKYIIIKYGSTEGSATTEFLQHDSKYLWNLCLIPVIPVYQIGNVHHVINIIWRNESYKVLQEYLMKVQIPDSGILPAIDVIRNHVGPLR